MSVLLSEQTEGVLTLTLHRPERRNALSHELIAALTHALDHAARDDAVRCVLLTAAPPAFCAGLDLDEVATASTTEFDATPLRDLLELLQRCPKPVVAAVNGPAAAGGAGLVCAAHVAIGGASAGIGYPGVRRGLGAPVIMPSLIGAIGLRRARYLLLTGTMLSAPQAAAWGLLHEVVADADLLPRARRCAAALAQLEPAAIQQTQALLAAWRDEPDGPTWRGARAAVYRPAKPSTPGDVPTPDARV